MKKSKNNIAIIIGSKGINATGLIRSLGQAGYYVVFASTYSKVESKWTNQYLHLPLDKSRKIDIVIQYIEGVGGKPSLFPTDDETAYLLDENYDKLKDICHLPHAFGKLREISDKTIMANMAESCGLCVPEYNKVELTDEYDVKIELPVIVKPYAGFAGSKGDIRLCYTKVELDEHLQKLREKGYKEVMVQRLLESSQQYEIGLMGCVLANGTVVLPCTIRKIRSYPAKRGSTSYAQIKRGLDVVDENAIKRFVRNTGYVGIFDIEMIISEGKAYFIEINYRNGQYGYAPTVAGYNIPDNWIKGMEGQGIEKNIAIDEMYYINERDDFCHVKAGAVSLAQWLKEFHNAEAYGMFCRGDQRPYIRQYVKMPDRIKILFEKIKNFMIREEWNVAYRCRQQKLLCEEGGCNGAFKIMPNTFRYWAADPFVVDYKGTDYMFFEMYDRFKQKGVIGYRIIQNGKVGKMNVAYEANTHLSFPYVFTYDGEFYMLPESANEKRLILLKAECFPDKWVEVKSWMNGIRLCDSIILQKDSDTYLFTQRVDRDYSFNSLHIYKYKDEEWEICCDSPIAKGKSNARMAGNFIEKDGTFIRVAQDCGDSYGKAINFNEIEMLDLHNYSERVVGRVEAWDIKHNRKGKSFDGVHTYNLNENYEVVDLKKEKVFNMGNILYYVSRLKRR